MSGARAWQAGLAGGSEPMLLEQMALPSESALISALDQRSQNLHPVTRAAGHSLSSKLRWQIFALAYSQAIFLEANGSIRVLLKSQVVQSFLCQKRIEFTSGFGAVCGCFLTANKTHTEFNAEFNALSYRVP